MQPQDAGTQLGELGINNRQRVPQAHEYDGNILGNIFPPIFQPKNLLPAKTLPLSNQLTRQTVVSLVLAPGLRGPIFDIGAGQQGGQPAHMASFRDTEDRAKSDNKCSTLFIEYLSPQRSVARWQQPLAHLRRQLDVRMVARCLPKRCRPRHCPSQLWYCRNSWARESLPGAVLILQRKPRRSAIRSLKNRQSLVQTEKWPLHLEMQAKPRRCARH